ncbi:MAG: hypothetical protein ACD_20C00149G0003 [uncultured bacterium]|nr:MAG: hypothetical protein ACD_20C00149G0003 [uncultured bacterium]
MLKKIIKKIAAGSISFIIGLLVVFFLDISFPSLYQIHSYEASNPFPVLITLFINPIASIAAVTNFAYAYVLSYFKLKSIDEVHISKVLKESLYCYIGIALIIAVGYGRSIRYGNL